MTPNVEELRERMSQLLEATRRETRLALSGIDPGNSDCRGDPERVVHNDQEGWRVRDVVGHLGVWNGEAARSLQAYAAGGEYHCISSEAKYDEYNASAVKERCAWDLEQVWAEYEASSAQLQSIVESMPGEKWNKEMLYPWMERGTIQNLIEVMMKHEVEHREIIVKSALGIKFS
jgi:hypothetical protein